MILVHDDNLAVLARIRGRLPPDAPMGHPKGSKQEIKYVLYGKYLSTSQLSISPY
jgi:hypothetical protein